MIDTRLPWTKEEKDVLQKMVEKGFTPEEISARVLKSRTPNAVRSKMAERSLILETAKYRSTSGSIPRSRYMTT